MVTTSMNEGGINFTFSLYTIKKEHNSFIGDCGYKKIIAGSISHYNSEI
jgi:hypothetical protein